jgi:hypothetical protein
VALVTGSTKFDLRPDGGLIAGISANDIPGGSAGAETSPGAMDFSELIGDDRNAICV